ncbi:MAG TPA: RNA polymerase sigma factor [Polyangiaceae bacterium]|nr:RNA polymerase sigma factor [Polyangiaceae bacterium]
MQPEQREELEREIRERWERGELQDAAAAAVRGYGPEIYGFLVAFHRQKDDASEVFAAFTERLWRGLPGFEWQCSFRTWAYAIARNTSLTYRRQARRRAEMYGPLPEGSQLSALEQPPRSETASYLKTQRQSRMAALRESLPREDQELLVLRVDRKLAWRDLARVLLHSGDGSSPSDEGLDREAARLRKRFQIVKEQLYEMGRREGLISDR